MENENPFQSLFDALDSAPMVCLLPHLPEIIYGPYTPEEAMDFCAKWNKFYAERGMPGKWEAKPLLKP